MASFWQTVLEDRLYLWFVISLNLFTIACYGYDKLAAIQGWRRIPESKMHFLSLLGGWLGAILAQRWFRHKTRKASFQKIQRRILCLYFVLLLLIFVDVFYFDLRRVFV